MYNYQLEDDNGVSTLEDQEMLFYPGTIFRRFTYRYEVIEWRNSDRDVVSNPAYVKDIWCIRKYS